MAIAAIGEGKLFLEITIQVAGDAGNLDVLSHQRVFGFGVIEIETGQKGLPAAGGVTGFARLLERSFVRIDVAGTAGIKFHVLIARRTARSVGLVALFARNFNMQAG